MEMLICVLGFPVNLSGDQLFPNLKRWKSSNSNVVGESRSGSWGGTQTKVEVHEYELTKYMFFQTYFLQLCLKKKRKITEFFPDTTVSYD